MRSRRSPAEQEFEAVPTRRGARLLVAGHVMSEILAQPGPTHSLFDLMAAGAAWLAPGRRLALLGFGGGSIVAPLRALGWWEEIEAVDLSLAAALAYARTAGDALGPVRVTLADAARWLRARRAPLDAIVEDLSVPSAGGDELLMPDVCFEALPALIGKRLAPRGLALVNVFSPGREGWDVALARLVPRGFKALVVEADDFDHRLLILGRSLPSPVTVSRALRSALASIRSRQRERFSVRAFRPPAHRG
jgi:hypothetical protein